MHADRARAPHACFPTPVLDPELAERRAGHAPKTPRAGGAADPVLSYLSGTDPALELSRLSDRELLALARLIPSLLCGEESAVIIFQHEGKRYGRDRTTTHLM